MNVCYQKKNQDILCQVFELLTVGAKIQITVNKGYILKPIKFSQKSFFNFSLIKCIIENS